jgi:benzoate-CoA ligase
VRIPARKRPSPEGGWGTGTGFVSASGRPDRVYKKLTYLTRMQEQRDSPLLSRVDHGVTPPRIDIPRVYNAAHDLLERNLLAGRADKIAYIDDAGTYSYAELTRRVNRFANGLACLGVHMEQRVLLCLHDTIDFPVAFLGCIKAGFVPVALNTLLSSADLQYILDDSRACAIVISSALFDAHREIFTAAQFLEYVVVSNATDRDCLAMSSLIESSEDTCEPAPTTCDDMCFWLYSSGSTGAPKGTVHIHSSLIQTAELYARTVAGYSESDLIFSVSKLPFAYGLGNSLTFPLAVGATAILMSERPTPVAVIERLRRLRPTVLCSIPTSFAALLAHTGLPRRDELRLRICTSAGEALPEAIGIRWRQHFGVDILDGIGSTEMLHIYLSNRVGDVRYGTTGYPVPGYEVRIVDDAGYAVSRGQSGEMHVRGSTRALLYWNNRARSCATFVGEWLRTGDTYREENGYYVYEGRRDDMLKVGGLYVSPMEVESALIQHEAVLEAAVVAKEDPEGLIKPCAYIVLRSGKAASAQELQLHVKRLLAPYKYPRWIEFVNELPKTATGKIQRFKLRQDTSRAQTAVK